MSATTVTVNIGYGEQTALVQGKTGPQNLGGLRVANFKFTADGTGTLAATPVVQLPAGSLVIYRLLCGAYSSDQASSATLDLGYAAHTDETGTAVNAAGDVILDGYAIDATVQAALAGTGTNAANLPPLRLNSQSGINITATVAGGNLTSGENVQGWIVFSGGTAN